MNNTTNIGDQARINSERATRVQTLRAMERLIVTMGTKRDYIAWLEAMPEETSISAAGGVGIETLNRVAADEQMYTAASKAFARQIGPVLMAMVSA